MKLLMCVQLVLLGLIANAQSRPITGTISDEKGQPVENASIRIKSVKQGSSADAAGNFSLTAKTGDVLLITATGFESREITIENEDRLRITLKSSSTELNGVVVTALGIKRQAKDLGYATSRVSNAQITQGKAVNLQNGLTGKVSGLNVTTVNSGVFEETRINLRDLRSLTGNNQPLLVLDGSPTPLAYMSSINPNDVQDVNVLKGASAAAIYGPDGVNGVIIVTTKKGSATKPIVTVGHTTQLARVAFMPKMQNRFGSGSGEDLLGRPVYTPYENQQYGPEFNGEMVDLGWPLENGDIQRVRYASLTDEKKKFWNTGMTIQNDVSFATQDFYISFQDADIKGLTPKDKNRRSSFRFNAAKTYDKFKASVGINYIQSNYNVVDNAGYKDRFQDSYNGSVYFSVLNTPMHVPLTSYKNPNNPYAKYENYYNEYFVNPYWVIDNHRNKGRSDDLLGSLELNYKIADWLSATYRAGTSLSFGNFKTERSPIITSTYAQNLRGSTFDPQPGSVADGSSMNSRINMEFFLNGKKSIGHFDISYLAGGQLRQNQGKIIGIEGKNLVVPYVFNINNKGGNADATESNFKNRLGSIFGSLAVNYKGWANLEVVARTDRDSRLHPDNNTYFYPGVNAAVVLSDAIPSLKNNTLLSFAKIRGSLTKSGNVNLGNYALDATYSQTGGFPYNVPGYSANDSIPDAGITPEFVLSKEVGIELGLLKNRVNIEATFFHQNNTDQILNVQQSAATGYPTRIANAADFVNYGVELDLRLTPLVNIGKGKLNFSINATYNNNKVKALFPGINEISIGGVTEFLQRGGSSPDAYNYAVVGLPAFVFKLSDYARDPQGRVIVDRNTGMPSVMSDSLITMGRSLPKWILGFNPSYTWKGLTVSMTWDYRGGHSVYHGIGNDMDFSGISARSTQFNRQRFVFPNSVYLENGKYVENKDVQVQNGGINFWTNGPANTAVATNYFTSANSWKLRELAISYDLPLKWFANGKVIKRAVVSAVGRNLLLFVPKSNQWTDPEFNYTATGNTNGVNNVFSTPPSRLFGGSISLTF